MKRLSMIIVRYRGGGHIAVRQASPCMQAVVGAYGAQLSRRETGVSTNARPFRKSHVDHQDEAARIVESMLAGSGFPMSKIEAVRGAIRTHMVGRDSDLRAESADLRSL